MSPVSLDVLERLAKALTVAPAELLAASETPGDIVGEDEGEVFTIRPALPSFRGPTR